ncbi:hypothetical protein GCM10023340_37020 [Nocardioides marinquilinus]|uniref:Uncharacterized protein n=1 Tax=Nocardioides marinquilinus TaxID=1210400 RepID=A0ABP9PZ64_9ACTN
MPRSPVRRPPALVAGVAGAVLCLTLAGCGDDPDGDPDAPAAPDDTGAPAATGSSPTEAASPDCPTELDESVTLEADADGVAVVDGTVVYDTFDSVDLLRDGTVTPLVEDLDDPEVLGAVDGDVVVLTGRGPYEVLRVALDGTTVWSVPAQNGAELLAPYPVVEVDDAFVDAATGEPTDPGPADPDTRPLLVTFDGADLLRSGVSATRTLYQDPETGAAAVTDAAGGDPVGIQADEYAALCGDLVYARTGLTVRVLDVADGEPREVTAVRLSEEPDQTLFRVGDGYASFTVGSRTVLLSDDPL